MFPHRFLQIREFRISNFFPSHSARIVSRFHPFYTRLHSSLIIPKGVMIALLYRDFVEISVSGHESQRESYTRRVKNPPSRIEPIKLFEPFSFTKS